MDPRDRKSDFDICQVDFEWVEKTKDIRQLRMGLKAIKDEGGYTALEEALQKKLDEIAPELKLPENKLSPEEQAEIEAGLSEWQENITKEDKELAQGYTPVANNHKKSEAEKLKGNEFMQAHEYDAAIESYNQAEKFDNKNSAVFCNRALAWLKKKQYNKCIIDCDTAIAINPDYVKAFHRRGKAYMAMKNYDKAIPDFVFIMSNEPKNKEVNADLQFCRNQVKGTTMAKIQVTELVDEENEKVKVQTVEHDPEEDPAYDLKPAAPAAKPKTSAAKPQATPAKPQAPAAKPQAAPAVPEAAPAKQEAPPAKQEFKRIQIEEDSSDEDEEEEAKPSEETTKETAPVKVQEETPSEEDLELEQILKEMTQRKENTTSLYQNGQFEAAYEQYSQIVDELLNLEYNNKQTLDDLKAGLYNNMALCQMQMSNSDLVIQLSTTALSIENASPAIRTKAFLRRGLAYEKLEKIEKANEDMKAVKQLDPSNLQASQALGRYATELRAREKDVLLKEKEKEDRLKQELARQIEQIKQNGNGCMARGELDIAVKEYTVGIEKLTEQKEMVLETPQLKELLLQWHNNRALTFLKLGNNEEAKSDSEYILTSLDPNNTKALHRAGKSNANLGFYTKALEYYKKAAETDKSEIIAKDIADVEKRLAEKPYLEQKEGSSSKPQETQQPELQKVSEERKEEPKSEIKLPELAKKESVKKTKIASDVITGAIEKAAANLEEEAPKTAYGFMTRASALKSTPDKFLSYLRLLTVEQLVSLFSATQVSYDLFKQILEALNISHDVVYRLELLEQLHKTHTFHLTVMFLGRADKEQVKELLGERTDLYAAYKIRT